MVLSELLRKEQASSRPHSATRHSKSDLAKLREKGLARQAELQERLAREARRRSELEKAKQSLETSKACNCCCWCRSADCWLTCRIYSAVTRICEQGAAHRHVQVGPPAVLALGRYAEPRPEIVRRDRIHQAQSFLSKDRFR